MQSIGLNITEEIFEVAWNCTSQNNRRELMMANYHILSTDILARSFEELGGVYCELANRKKAHEVALKDSKENEELAEYLKKIGYVTSWKFKMHSGFDSVTSQNKVTRTITLRIKQVK